MPQAERPARCRLQQNKKCAQIFDGYYGQQLSVIHRAIYTPHNSSGRSKVLEKDAKELTGLAKQIIQGIVNAQKAYRKMSVQPFGARRRYLITTKIAEVLSKKYSQRVDLEKSVRKALNLTAEETQKLPKELGGGNGRSDIFLSWEKK